MLLIAALALAHLVIFTPSAHAAVCTGNACTGKDPKDAGCFADRQGATYVTIYKQGFAAAIVWLEHSSVCDANWVEVMTTGGQTADLESTLYDYAARSVHDTGTASQLDGHMIGGVTQFVACGRVRLSDGWYYGCTDCAPPTTAAGAPLAATPLPTPCTAPLPAPALSAHAAYLLNPDTGMVYLARNADAKVPMASTTKIITALVALTIARPETHITIGADAVALENSGDSVANLGQGDVLTLRDLLYGLLLPSGDDAAVAIADGTLGSQARFVAMMNLEAALLGLWHTHYADVHGLDDPAHQHYTTARDLAQLAEIAMRSPLFAKIVATPTYALPATAAHQAYTWKTTNALLTTWPYAGVTGVKTGFTGDAGDCFVFTAERPYGRLLGVVLGEPSNYDRFADARALLNWGFAVENGAAAGA
jgi:D-alanyl-D-alanine carboxypeptidase (penicillin-binding protein 5/6)